jgi:DNA-binding response OmpR family regulator
MNPTPHAAAAQPAARGRILVVEDDQDTALFLTHVLGQRGEFDVTHTPDPAVALSLVTAQSWDLVVTDLELPVMHGRELIGALRRLVPALPVMIITAHEAAARGIACPVLVKPLRVDQLISTATALITGSAVQRRPDT